MCFMCKSDGTLGEPVTGSIRLVAEAAGTSRRVVTVDARAAMVCVALVNRITAAEGDAAISVPETDGTTLLTVLDYCKRRVAAAAEEGGTRAGEADERRVDLPWPCVRLLARSTEGQQPCKPRSR